MPDVVNRIGNGQYLAYAEYFACRDAREQMWRLSRITYSSTKVGEMHFSYIGEFDSQTGIEEYISTH